MQNFVSLKQVNNTGTATVKYFHNQWQLATLEGKSETKHGQHSQLTQVRF